MGLVPLRAQSSLETGVPTRQDSNMTNPSTTATDTRPERRTRGRKSTRTSFGSVRRLPSGRFQARYTDR